MWLVRLLQLIVVTIVFTYFTESVWWGVGGMLSFAILQGLSQIAAAIREG